MSETGREERKYYYLQEDGCEDIQIRRYMDLDKLIVLLETNKLVAKRRKEYTDEHESLPPLMYTFAVTPCGEHPQMSVKEKIFTQAKRYSEIRELPTSCWTKNNHESYLMWKSYASNMGVCIQSSSHRLIQSLTNSEDIKVNDYDIYCGSMNYYQAVKVPMREEWMFWKDREFSDEKEFRFYFEFNKDDNKDDSIKLIPINPSILIEKVILSPFIDINARHKLASILQREYGINVEPSKIKIKLC